MRSKPLSDTDWLPPAVNLIDSDTATPETTTEDGWLPGPNKETEYSQHDINYCSVIQ